jgi:hypothetical protein
VPDIVVVDGLGQLDFDGHEPPVVAFDDQVDLLPPRGPHVAHARLAVGGVDQHESATRLSKSAPSSRPARGMAGPGERPASRAGASAPSMRMAGAGSANWCF